MTACSWQRGCQPLSRLPNLVLSASPYSAAISPKRCTSCRRHFQEVLTSFAKKPRRRRKKFGNMEDGASTNKTLQWSQGHCLNLEPSKAL